MFNFYTYQKQLDKEKKLAQMKQDFIHSSERHQSHQSRMALNYKKRVENFVINMIEEPIKYCDYKDKAIDKFRPEEEPSKFLGDAQWYVKGFKHEKDRIQESQLNHALCEFCPTYGNQKHSFRDRHIDKEIQPDMRYTSKTSLERIEQLLKDHMQREVENLDFRENIKRKKIITNLPEGVSAEQKRQYMCKEIAKGLLSSLHHKTHFNAAQALYNNLPVSSLCDYKSASQSTSPMRNQQIQEPFLPEINESAIKKSSSRQQQKRSSTLPRLESKDHIKLNIYSPDEKMLNFSSVTLDQNLKNKTLKNESAVEAFNPVETSKKILLNCNIIKPKNTKIDTILTGDGHNISAIDKTVSQVYRDIYNRNISSFNFSKTTIKAQ